MGHSIAKIPWKQGKDKIELEERLGECAELAKRNANKKTHKTDYYLCNDKELLESRKSLGGISDEHERD